MGDLNPLIDDLMIFYIQQVPISPNSGLFHFDPCSRMYDWICRHQNSGLGPVQETMERDRYNVDYLRRYRQGQVGVSTSLAEGSSFSDLPIEYRCCAKFGHMSCIRKGS